MGGSQKAADGSNGEVAAKAGGRLRRSFLAPALLLSALLAGCATPEAPPQAATQQPAARPVARPVAFAPAASPEAERTLTGLTADELLARFGEPSFRRDEAPAELWQYRTVDCVLDVFLYREAGHVRVIHAETRDRSLIHAAPGRCAPHPAPPAILRQSRL